MSPAVGLSFDEALATIRQVAAEHLLDAETLPLSRCHGRVLARDAFAPVAHSDTVPDDGLVLGRGGWLGPLQMGRLAAAGVSSLTVSRRPTVAVFTIGDALIEPGLPLVCGQSHDGSRELLMGLLRADGLEPTAWPLLADERRPIEVALRDAGCAFDLIVTCGGTPAHNSDGRRHVAAVVEEFGRSHFRGAGTVNGGSVVFGSLDQARLLAFAFDADAIAALWLTLGRALVDGLQGRTAPRMRLRARLLHEIGCGDAFRLVPGRIVAADDGLAVEPLAHIPTETPDAPPVCGADAWIPTDARPLPAGTIVNLVHP